MNKDLICAQTFCILVNQNVKNVPTSTHRRRQISSTWDLSGRFLLSEPRERQRRFAETAVGLEVLEAAAESGRRSGGRWSTAGRRGRSDGRRRRLRESGWCWGDRPPGSEPTTCLGRWHRFSQSGKKRFKINWDFPGSKKVLWLGGCTLSIYPLLSFVFISLQRKSLVVSTASNKTEKVRNLK